MHLRTARLRCGSSFERLLLSSGSSGAAPELSTHVDSSSPPPRGSSVGAYLHIVKGQQTCAIVSGDMCGYEDVCGNGGSRKEEERECEGQARAVWREEGVVAVVGLGLVQNSVRDTAFPRPTGKGTGSRQRARPRCLFACGCECEFGFFGSEFPTRSECEECHPGESLTS